MPTPRSCLCHPLPTGCAAAAAAGTLVVLLPRQPALCTRQALPCSLNHPLQVTALVQRGGSRAPVEACTLLSGLQNPNGLAYDAATGALYVAEVLVQRGWVVEWHAAGAVGSQARRACLPLLMQQLPPHPPTPLQVRAITRYDGADAAALARCDASLLRATGVVGPDVLPPQVRCCCIRQQSEV